MLTGGREIELYIDNYNHSGEGVGRCRDMAVFVPFAAPGEKVRARVTETRKNYARAEMLEIIEPAGFRTAPRCRTFGKCGGCRLQHIDYPEQLSAKRELVRQSLSRIGGFGDISVEPVIGMADPWHYRNKVHFQAEDRDGRLVLGFYEEGSHRLAETAGTGDSPLPLHCRCLLVDRDLNALAGLIEEMLNRYGVRAYNRLTGRGMVRHVLLRKASGTGEMMAVLATGPGDWPAEKDFAAELAKAFPGVKSVLRHVNPEPGNRVPGGGTLLLKGSETIEDIMEGLRFSLSAESFYQVNSVQTVTLYNKALEFAGLSGGETVVDAYSGVGTIALFFARKAGKVLGLEIVARAVADALANAALNGLANVEFHQGAVEKLLPRLVRRERRPDVLVLDPPRRGCHIRVLETIAETGVPRVVYVSCDPGTLARDLRRLAEWGYAVRKVQPVDMFPQTHHVESIVLMTKSGLKGK
ncbi:RNA methyltransferase [Desulfocucumis palustris]|uniref:RNA methyltransferase n=1 Tax=Desulfocucumis palustris TaxID=1898651 RepID=A0A2L2XAZ3_9FIRM|nr:23S rRNA (uracil(1939)-C(5))-methyltransferase RlmD [Desulfocucumis palustris]GBF33348.1 RNA methyltransferase [Desulfocucumis palustris]